MNPRSEEIGGTGTPTGIGKETVIGKFSDDVFPATTAFPDVSTATARAWSSLVPPIYVEYTYEEPEAFNFVTNASKQLPSAAVLQVRRMALEVVGKSLDAVDPAMMALPDESTAIPLDWSSSVPPMYVA